ncbi:microspherule protein 1 isoform X2 [Centruroides vittatus]|uniref:microspherule protein 1 isoform X2 n=1 Tax=Centruroides vittatus TaxID=120091 RepID=UPI00350E9E3E
MSSTGALSSDSSQDAAAAVSASISGCPIPSSSLTCGMEDMMADIPSKIDSFQKRRSSSRSIKRKKFDDEVVESSLVKSSRNRPPSGSLIGIGGSSFSTTTLSTIMNTGCSEQIFSEMPQVTIPEKKKPSKSTPKRIKKSKNSQSVVTKDLGRWKPADDLALIFAVQQINDLESVYRGVKFSCKFTLQEVQERWYALLYDPVISKVAVNAMKQLHPDIIAQVQAKTLFGQDEENLLSTIPSTSQPTIETFQELMNQQPDVFLPSRTAKSLFTHWNLMKQYHLLPDQTVQPLPKGDHVLNFSDAEDMIDDNELMEPADEALEHELTIADRCAKRDIRQLENELPKWQVLVDSITGVSPADFDNQTLAVLRGRLVRYLMRSREITLGRATKDINIDVDLSLEGPAWKISRRQGVIKLHNGDFYIANEGKRPFFVDGKPVLTGNKYKLENNAVVEIVGLRFIFLINQDLIAAIRADATKNIG